jgi:hypothetical protein
MLVSEVAAGLALGELVKDSIVCEFSLTRCHPFKSVANIGRITDLMKKVGKGFWPFLAPVDALFPTTYLSPRKSSSIKAALVGLKRERVGFCSLADRAILGRPE